MAKSKFRSMLEQVFGSTSQDETARIEKAVSNYFKTFTDYAPVFTTWQGGIYEAELVRSAIQAGAEHASKLKPEVAGVAQKQAGRALQLRPNPWQTTPQFLAKIWTMLHVDDTCLIVPIHRKGTLEIVGYYPVLPQACRAYDVGGQLWLKLQFADGSTQFIEWSRVGVLTRHQYRSDLFGDGGNVLDPTMQLLHAQDEAQENAIKHSAAVRFIGKFSQLLDPEDMKERQQEFNRQNLESSNAGGIAVYDQSFDEVKQITPQNYVIDDEQVKIIQDSVFRYIGISDPIIKGNYTEEEFNAFYESKIESFAVQLGSVLTCMTYSGFEIANGNEISFSSNRLEYASNTTKLRVTTSLYDRGLITGDQVMDIWQLPHYEGGDRRVIRGEYIDLSLIEQHTLENARVAAETNANVSLIDGQDEEQEQTQQEDENAS